MIEVFKNVPLATKTFYGIGGPADEIFEIHDASDLPTLWAESCENSIPKIVLGRGSNIVFSDKGLLGRVFIPKFKKTLWRENVVTVEAGKTFQDFIEETNKKGFSDLCELSGIPGNIGGFVRGNAGANDKEVSDSILGVEYLNEKGYIHKLTKEACKFGYRESLFKKNPDFCIIRTTFELKEKLAPQTALDKTKRLLSLRWEKSSPGKSSGCVFKNPIVNGKTISTGKLLDELGAKGDQIGDIKISEFHANFFINKGKATQKDLLSLMNKWKKRVFKIYQIELESEIFICNEFGQKINLES